MERRGFYNQRENGFSYTERCVDKYQMRKVLFYQLCGQGQDLFDVVSFLAKCSHGSTYVCAGNVAMGMFVPLVFMLVVLLVMDSFELN